MTAILVVTNMYPPHHYGGYELSCRDFCRRMVARGHRVTVLTSQVRVAGVTEPDGGDGVGVRRELDLYWDDHRLVTPSLRRRVALERDNQRRVADVVAAALPDVVSVWAMGGMSTGLLSALVDLGRPLLYAVCDEWLDYAVRMDAWMRLFVGRPRLGALARRITGLPTSLPDVGRSGTFCFVSAAVRAQAEQASPWTFPDATIVYSGIDLTDFPIAGAAAVEERRTRPWSRRLLYVGRLDPRKGVHTAIEAVGLLDGATLDVLGEGDEAYARELRSLAARLGVADRVSFGAAPRHELRARYDAADVVVFPSTWAEPFGLVPLEAMATGAPVVATGLGGSGEFLADDVNCVRFRAGDARSLADAVLAVEADPPRRARLICAGLATAAAMDVETWADLLERWHVAVAERFASGRPEDRPPPVVTAP